MDILQIETEASKLREKLSKTNSLRITLLQIFIFYKILLKEDHKNAIESYLLEFIDVYSKLLSLIDISGLHPSLTAELLNQASNIEENYISGERKILLNNSIIVVKEKNEQLNEALKGNEYNHSNVTVSFPLIQKGLEIFKNDFGLLGSLSVQLKPNKSGNNYHVIPSNYELDPLLNKQIEDALKNAVRIAGNYIKIKDNYWDVYVDFGNTLAEYSGNSFGLTLVLYLVEELLRFYDSPTKIISNSNLVLTGAVDNYGKVPSLSKEIIQQKTKIVFYSTSKIFVIPEDDFSAAKNNLEDLISVYPNRDLKIIGIQTIDDLFNLRNVVEIKKENFMLRAGKFMLRRAVSITLLILLAGVIFFSGIWDFDNNPASVNYVGKVFQITNKSGKVLWSVNSKFEGDNTMDNYVYNNSVKFYDINNDKKNEVFICNENISFEDPNYGRIICYNYKKQKIWQYVFHDSISTLEYHHSTTFFTNLIGIINNGRHKLLYAFANNLPLYPCAIFTLDAVTGKRIDSMKTFWHSGGINSAILGDFNSDGKKEIAALAVNNGYERSVLFDIDVNEINSGCSPAPPYYHIVNHKIANFNQYILLPKTDLTRKYFRWNSPLPGYFYFKDRSSEFNFQLAEYDSLTNTHFLIYRCNRNMSDFNIDCSDDFQIVRDSLVIHGILNPPLTYTSEYFRSLKNQIRYWNGQKFVTKKERFN